MPAENGPSSPRRENTLRHSVWREAASCIYPTLYSSDAFAPLVRARASARRPFPLVNIQPDSNLTRAIPSSEIKEFPVHDAFRRSPVQLTHTSAPSTMETAPTKLETP